MSVLEQCTLLVVRAVSQTVNLAIECFNFLNMGELILGLICAFLSFRYLLQPFIGWVNNSVDIEESQKNGGGK